MTSTTTNTAAGGESEATMAATQTFKSFDGSTITVLADGRAIRRSILGWMLLTAVGGEFVRFLTDDEAAEAVAS